MLDSQLAESFIKKTLVSFSVVVNLWPCSGGEGCNLAVFDHARQPRHIKALPFWSLLLHHDVYWLQCPACCSLPEVYTSQASLPLWWGRGRYRVLVVRQESVITIVSQYFIYLVPSCLFSSPPFFMSHTFTVYTFFCTFFFTSLPLRVLLKPFIFCSFTWILTIVSLLCDFFMVFTTHISFEFMKYLEPWPQDLSCIIWCLELVQTEKLIQRDWSTNIQGQRCTG